MKNFFCLILVISTLLLGACSSTCKNGQKSVETYQKELSGLLKMIRSDVPNLELIQETSLALMDLSEPIYVHFSKRAPDCKYFLKEVLDHREKMLLIDLEAIERDYHEGEGLSSAPDHCFHAKELVVHPATVYLLAKEPFNAEIRESMLDELVELGAHLDEFIKDNE